MPNLQELETIFRNTFEDRVFTRAEKQAVKQLLDQEPLDDQALGVMRAKIFDMAREEMKQHPVDAVLNWLEIANKLLLPSGEKESAIQNRAYFSPGDDCRNAINALLRSARHSVKICVFTISDNTISDEIIQCHRRKVSVKIISDNEKTEDLGSDIDQLAQKGIPIRIDQSPNHMHHKFAIIDKATLLTGSYNWTRSAMQHNQENILVTDDPELVEMYLKEFERLWENLYEL